MRASFLQIIALCLLTATIFGACKSKRDSADPSSYWIIDGVRYIMTTSYTRMDTNLSRTQIDYTLRAADGSFLEDVQNTVDLSFGDKPLMDGSILIGREPGQLHIGLSQTIGFGGKEKYYTNQAASTDRASYTFTNGKITVDIPEITLLAFSGSNIKFSAHIVEQ